MEYSNFIELNSKLNGMQIGVKGIENLLMIIVLERKKTLKRQI
jgi:hypothetical protein